MCPNTQWRVIKFLLTGEFNLSRHSLIILDLMTRDLVHGWATWTSNISAMILPLYLRSILILEDIWIAWTSQQSQYNTMSTPSIFAEMHVYKKASVPMIRPQRQPFKRVGLSKVPHTRLYGYVMCYGLWRKLNHQFKTRDNVTVTCCVIYCHWHARSAVGRRLTTWEVRRGVTQNRPLHAVSCQGIWYMI